MLIVSVFYSNSESEPLKNFNKHIYVFINDPKRGMKKWKEKN
jgi:hypothetical protein